MILVEQHCAGHYYTEHHSCHRSGYCEGEVIARIERGSLEGDLVLALHRVGRQGRGLQDSVGRGYRNGAADSPCGRFASLAEIHRDLALSAGLASQAG